MHSLEQILGDYQYFFELQRSRLKALGINIEGCTISHLAYRTAQTDEYLEVREELEQHASANVENVWNGRPISKILLRQPILLASGFEVSLIELIPPPHQRVYKMGLEHLGVVMGDKVDHFGRIHRAVLTGQQFQSHICEPYYVLFAEDYSHVKFYRYGLQQVCEMEGRQFDGFYHA